MNNRKGFTLIEIIVCISLVAIVGVGSFIGIKLVDKKLLKDKLSQITDKAIEAAQVYIETNKETYNQLYTNQNGVSLPLQLLVNEGLLTLDGTKLDSNDIKNQYVITFLGNTGSSGSDNCEKITSTTSWGNDKEIYLCMNGDGSSNLATIDPSKYSNKTKVMNEPYYFKGAGAHNYVKYNDKIYRIYYIDTDDTLVLYNKGSFGNTFDGNTLPISTYNVSNNSNFRYDKYVFCNGVDNIPRTGEQEGDVYTKNAETYINAFDVLKTSYCITNANIDTNISVKVLDAWMEFSWKYYGNSSANGYYIDFPSSSQPYKIHLNSSFKLGSGTGDYSNPYILEKK